MEQSIQQSVIRRISIYQVCCGFGRQLSISTISAAHHCVVHATPSSCCSKNAALLLLNYGPSNPVLNPIDYKISKFILQYENNLWLVSHRDWKKKQAAEVLDSRNTAFKWKCYFCVSVVYQVRRNTRWSGRINWLLIAQSLSNVVSKNVKCDNVC